MWLVCHAYEFIDFSKKNILEKNKQMSSLGSLTAKEYVGHRICELLRQTDSALKTLTHRIRDANARTKKYLTTVYNSRIYIRHILLYLQHHEPKSKHELYALAVLLDRIAEAPKLPPKELEAEIEHFGRVHKRFSTKQKHWTKCDDAALLISERKHDRVSYLKKRADFIHTALTAHASEAILSDTDIVKLTNVLTTLSNIMRLLRRPEKPLEAMDIVPRLSQIAFSTVSKGYNTLLNKGLPVHQSSREVFLNRVFNFLESVPVGTTGSIEHIPRLSRVPSFARHDSSQSSRSSQQQEEQLTLHHIAHKEKKPRLQKKADSI